MATAIVTLSRSIHAIVTDLATTHQRIAVNIANDECDREWDRLTDRRDVLESELKAAIYATRSQGRSRLINNLLLSSLG